MNNKTFINIKHVNIAVEWGTDTRDGMHKYYEPFILNDFFYIWDKQICYIWWLICAISLFRGEGEKTKIASFRLRHEITKRLKFASFRLRHEITKRHKSATIFICSFFPPRVHAR